MGSTGKMPAPAGAMVEAKAVLRALRFLAAQPATMRAASTGDAVLLEAGEGGTISIPRLSLASALRLGLIDHAGGGRLSISEEGRAALRRARGGADAFLAQHREIEERQFQRPEGGSQTVAVNLRESPLAQLARRRGHDGRPLLDPREVEAGERLRSDYDRAMIMPRLGINWQAPIGGGGGRGPEDLTQAALAARRRVEQALDAVGPELSGVLVDVCCFLKGLEQVEAERRWPARSAKIVLKSALGCLGRHYHPGHARGRSILHWGAEGYRPRLDAGAS